MPQPAAKTSRIEARIARDALATIRRGAEISGRSLSDFVGQAAEEAALRAIEQAQILRLVAHDQARFAKAIAAPPKPATGLRRAAARHKRLIAAG